MEASLQQRIDFLAIAINVGGDKKAVRELLELFMHSNAELLKRMEEAEEDLNLIAWLQLAHQIKGSANYLGAKRFVALCIEAEEIKKLPSEQSSAVMYHLTKEFAHLREAIDKHLATLI